MGIDRDYYITLYSIAMEEVRHHHRLYTEIWVAGIFMGGVFFTALYFLSGRPYLTRPFMIFITVFGCLVMVTFYWVSMRRGIIAERCREIAKELEDILAGKRQDDTLELANLLLTQQIEARLKQRRHVLWKVFYRPWTVFLFGLLVLWVYLCLTLLKV